MKPFNGPGLGNDLIDKRDFEQIGHDFSGGTGQGDGTDPLLGNFRKNFIKNIPSGFQGLALGAAIIVFEDFSLIV